MNAAARQSALDAFRHQCKHQGLACTFQRQVIYEAILDSPSHPTPELIFEQVRARIPAVSLGTVYKNIHTFLESGLLKEVSLHHGTLRLEANLSPHHHVVCSRCKSIVDVDADAAMWSTKKWRPPVPKGFQVERLHLEIVGICGSCAAVRSSKQQSRGAAVRAVPPTIRPRKK
jgi:Fur family peroxide stress response transcriptional regulator